MSVCSVNRHLRELFWSPLCETSETAYRGFLESLANHGYRYVAVGDCNGTSDDSGCKCRRVDVDVGTVVESVEFGGEGKNSLVASSSVATIALDSKDNGDNCDGQAGAAVSDSRISVGGFGSIGGGFVCSGSGKNVCVDGGSGGQPDARFNAGPFPYALDDLHRFDRSYKDLPVRGPNYERNRASRLRAKIRKEEKSRLREALTDDPNVELSQKVRRLKLERQEIQEVRKLDKLRSPIQLIEDAMRQVTLAEKYAKSANDSRVAAWANKIATSSAESIAKSSGSSYASVVSGKASTVGTSVSSRPDKFSLKALLPCAAERKAIELRVIRPDQIESNRRIRKRMLKSADFYDKNFPVDIAIRDLREIREAEIFDEGCDIDVYA